MISVSAPVKYALIVSVIILVGCADKPEHARAKELLGQFSCPTANGVWANFMKDNRDKAHKYMENYEKGLQLINQPIDEVIQIQLNEFKDACDSSNKNKPFP
ncbi:hypothetical protein EZJ19_15205 [Parasulfuritortus cantonensis]|uniref:Uncharacterized protein n=1 Tax=Parasulfuritortus cantonensis TaxID=2528202 RepID=A0A4R1B570_9PROT|nr:hypothetical protein [Parasulfuritortus cantonensis]TCJ11617.1 hypothetical protein EZJ19_15205 [Parasulfuritortus cantonensis]